MPICVICEKPSQGRDIARLLGATTRKEGHLEGNGYWVTWCVGHLLSMAPPETYSSDCKPWRWSALPVVPDTWQLIPNPNTTQQLAIVQRLLQQTNHVWIATDADREGDVIGREILAYSGFKGTVERLWLSALDDTSILRAIKNIKPDAFSRGLYQAGLGRQRADWLIGMNVTMATTVAFAQDNEVLSVGRVQSPTLALVVDRDQRIESFTIAYYYDLVIQVKSPDGVSFEALWEVPEEARCLQRSIAEGVMTGLASSPTLTVMSYVSEEKRQTPPLGLSLSTLQTLASAKWGYTAKQTLAIAQSLYEHHKAITYPRTDCGYLPESQYPDAAIIVPLLQRDPRYSNLPLDLNHKSPIWNDRKITAHHAMIPTTNPHVDVTQFTEGDRHVYDLIVQYYLAQFMGDYVYTRQAVTLSFNEHRFIAKAKTPMVLGWRSLIPMDEEEQPSTLPVLTEQAICHYQQGTVQEKKTKPPARFTEGTLISAMKNIAQYLDDSQAKKILKATAGIGTEATRAAIIETLLHREYLRREGKTLISTPKGRRLISLLPKTLTNPLLTAQWESELASIAENQGTLDQFMQAQTKALHEMLASYEPPVAFTCQQCQLPLKRRKGKRGDIFWGCAGYPNCKVVYPDQGGKPLIPADIHPCPTCQQGILQLREGKRGKFWGCSRYPLCLTLLNDAQGKPAGGGS